VDHPFELTDLKLSHLYIQSNMSIQYNDKAGT